MTTPAQKRDASRAYCSRATRHAVLATRMAWDAQDAGDAAALRYERQVTQWLSRHPTGRISDRLNGRHPGHP